MRLAVRINCWESSAHNENLRSSEAIFSVLSGSRSKYVPNHLLTELAANTPSKWYAEMHTAGHPFRESHIRAAVDDLQVTGRLVEVPAKGRATGYNAV